MSEPLRINFGCGKSPVDGWVNVDGQLGDGVDFVTDLNWGRTPWNDGEVEESMASHVIEHLDRPLHFMQEVWRITKSGGIITVTTPYGGSDDAWENPDHRRPYFLKSWGFFGQPNYWREDSYGYTADWRVLDVELRVTEDSWERWIAHRPIEVAIGNVNTLRNVVSEMSVTMEAVKPARSQDKALQEPVPVRFSVLVPVDEDGKMNYVVDEREYDKAKKADREEG